MRRPEPNITDRVLVAAWRESPDPETSWLDAKTIADRGRIPSGRAGQALIKLRADNMVESREVAATKRQWRLTGNGRARAEDLLPRIRGRKPPELQGAAPDGLITILDPAGRIRVQASDPYRWGFRRFDEFGVRDPQPRPRKRRSTRARRHREARRRHRARSRARVWLRIAEQQAQLREIEAMMEQLAEEGQIVKDPETGLFSAVPKQAPAQRSYGAFILPRDADLLVALGKAASDRGWALASDVTKLTGVPAQSVGRTFSTLADRNLVERWTPGPGASLYRVTAAGEQALAA